MNKITILPPDVAARVAALGTLDQILNYMDIHANRFSHDGLVHGLGRRGEAGQVLMDLAWLVARGYLVKEGLIFSLTRKGLGYASDDPGNDDDSSFRIEFTSSPAPEPVRPDPRRR